MYVKFHANILGKRTMRMYVIIICDIEALSTWNYQYGRLIARRKYVWYTSSQRHFIDLIIDEVPNK